MKIAELKAACEAAGIDATGKKSALIARLRANEEAQKKQASAVVVPEDQLELSEKEMEEEHTRILRANNPLAPDNIARFSNKERTYKFDPMVSQTHVHFELEGNMMHKDSEDAKRQLAREETIEQNMKAAQEAIEKQNAEASGDEDEKLEDVRNDFNFAERGLQTTNNPPKAKGTMTVPPPAVGFSATATQWEIYDAYVTDLENQAKEKLRQEKGKKKKGGDKKPAAKQEEKSSMNEDHIHSAKMFRSLKIVERMVNQNSFDDIIQDYKYWEDQSDSFRETGSLLPLWIFTSAKSKRKHVTALSWSGHYSDMFAVGYGSYDFTKQSTGVICCHTLKNPSAPEFVFTTESGVMCLDFHQSAGCSSLLAVGLYDGTVMVYDLGMKQNFPIFQSTVRTGKHTDPVWQVSWQTEDVQKALSFTSISSDGRVTLWTMSKNELQFADVMELKLVAAGDGFGDEDDETALSGLAGGCCIDFNKTSDHLFIVGTEEGTIHKCSKAYNSQYLDTYEGHTMNVYRVCWNSYHPRAFLSCSADWTVKLWDHNAKAAVMTWDLNNAVNDVAWAPFSATVFAAVTADSKVHVFDLAQNKHEPMCEQKVIRKKKLTHIAFNPKEPIIVVGDDNGHCTALKLSPNLRKLFVLPSHLDKDGVLLETPVEPEEARKWNAEQRAGEIDRLEQIIQLASQGGSDDL